MQSMTEFPDIPNPPEPLKEKARIDKLVIFIGAGVSRLVGCPSWDELAHKYLEDLWQKSKSQHKTTSLGLSYYEYKQLKGLPARRLLSICDAIYEQHPDITRPPLSELCKYECEKFKKSKIFTYLRDFHAIYVTTNYDECLEDATPSLESIESGSIGEGAPGVNPANPKLRVFSNIEELLESKLEENALLHLHGNIKEEKTAIITFEDYLRHYRTGQNPAELLKVLFEEDYGVLFVGYGLDEFEILEYIVSRPKTGERTLRNIFVLFPLLRQQKMFRFWQLYYKSMGIEMLPYAIDDKGYDQLESVLAEWAKEFKRIPHSKSYMDGLNIIDKAM